MNPMTFSSVHFGLKSWEKFIISHYQMLLIAHWPVMPPLTILSPGYFLHHHTALGRRTHLFVPCQ